MAVRVKYNHTMKFRRWSAFLRMYRSKNPRMSVLGEMIWIPLGIALAATYWFRFADRTERYLIYLFFFIVAFTLYRIVKLLRAGVMVLRVRKVPPQEQDKEYFFDERGFTFGPLDAQGKMVETRWRDVDQVFYIDGVVYILCEGRRNWAAVDLMLMTEGTTGELTGLIQQNLRKRQIVGSL